MQAATEPSRASSTTGGGREREAMTEVMGATYAVGVDMDAVNVPAEAQALRMRFTKFSSPPPRPAYHEPLTPSPAPGFKRRAGYATYAVSGAAHEARVKHETRAVIRERERVERWHHQCGG
jgi:hypothetical protein